MCALIRNKVNLQFYYLSPGNSIDAGKLVDFGITREHIRFVDCQLVVLLTILV